MANPERGSIGAEFYSNPKTAIDKGLFGVGEKETIVRGKENLGNPVSEEERKELEKARLRSYLETGVNSLIEQTANEEFDDEEKRLGILGKTDVFNDFKKNSKFLRELKEKENWDDYDKEKLAQIKAANRDLLEDLENQKQDRDNLLNVARRKAQEKVLGGVDLASYEGEVSTEQAQDIKNNYDDLVSGKIDKKINNQEDGFSDLSLKEGARLNAFAIQAAKLLKEDIEGEEKRRNGQMTVHKGVGVDTQQEAKKNESGGGGKEDKKDENEKRARKEKNERMKGIREGGKEIVEGLFQRGLKKEKVASFVSLMKQIANEQGVRGNDLAREELAWQKFDDLIKLAAEGIAENKKEILLVLEEIKNEASKETGTEITVFEFLNEFWGEFGKMVETVEEVKKEEGIDDEAPIDEGEEIVEEKDWKAEAKELGEELSKRLFDGEKIDKKSLIEKIKKLKEKAEKERGEEIKGGEIAWEYMEDILLDNLQGGLVDKGKVFEILADMTGEVGEGEGENLADFLMEIWEPLREKLRKELIGTEKEMEETKEKINEWFEGTINEVDVDDVDWKGLSDIILGFNEGELLKEETNWTTNSFLSDLKKILNNKDINKRKDELKGFFDKLVRHKEKNGNKTVRRVAETMTSMFEGVREKVGGEVEKMRENEKKMPDGDKENKSKEGKKNKEILEKKEKIFAQADELLKNLEDLPSWEEIFKSDHVWSFDEERKEEESDVVKEAREKKKEEERKGLALIAKRTEQYRLADLLSVFEELESLEEESGFKDAEISQKFKTIKEKVFAFGLELKDKAGLKVLDDYVGSMEEGKRKFEAKESAEKQAKVLIFNSGAAGVLLSDSVDKRDLRGEQVKALDEFLAFVTLGADRYYSGFRSTRSKAVIDKLLGVGENGKDRNTIAERTYNIMGLELNDLFDDIYSSSNMLETNSTARKAVEKSIILGKVDLSSNLLKKFLADFAASKSGEKKKILEGYAKTMIDFFGVEMTGRDYHKIDNNVVPEKREETLSLRLLDFHLGTMEKEDLEAGFLQELRKEIENRQEKSEKKSVVDLMFDVADVGLFSRKFVSLETGTIVNKEAVFKEHGGVFGNDDIGSLAQQTNGEFNTHEVTGVDYERYDLETMGYKPRESNAEEKMESDDELSKVQVVVKEMFRIITTPDEEKGEKSFTVNKSTFFNKNTIKEILDHIFAKENLVKYPVIGEKFAYDSEEMISFYKKIIAFKFARDNLAAKASVLIYGRDISARKSDLGGSERTTDLVAEFLYQIAKARAKKDLIGVGQMTDFSLLLKNMLKDRTQLSRVEVVNLFERINGALQENNIEIDEDGGDFLRELFLGMAEKLTYDEAKRRAFDKMVAKKEKEKTTVLEKQIAENKENVLIKQVEGIDLNDEKNGKRLENAWQNVLDMIVHVDADMMFLYEPLAYGFDFSKLKYSFKHIFDAFPPIDDYMNNPGNIEGKKGQSALDYYKAKGAYEFLLDEGNKVIMPGDFSLEKTDEIKDYFTGLTSQYSMIMGYAGAYDESSRKNNINEFVIAVLNTLIAKVILSVLHDYEGYPSPKIEAAFKVVVSAINQGLTAGLSEAMEQNPELDSNALKATYFEHIDKDLMTLDISNYNPLMKLRSGEIKKADPTRAPEDAHQRAFKDFLRKHAPFLLLPIFRGKGEKSREFMAEEDFNDRGEYEAMLRLFYREPYATILS